MVSIGYVKKVSFCETLKLYRLSLPRRWQSPLAVEHRSDRGIADEIAIGQKKQYGRYDANNDDLYQARERPLGYPNLHDLDEGQVSDVEPVGGIGNEADFRTLPREEFAEHPDQTENHKPDEQGRAKGNDFVAKLQVCPLHKAQRGHEDNHRNEEMDRPEPSDFLMKAFVLKADSSIPEENPIIAQFDPVGLEPDCSRRSEQPILSTAAH